MQTEPLTFYPKHPSNMRTLLIKTTPMPILHQDTPFDVEPLFDAFNADRDDALAVYKDKRFEVTAI